MGVESKHAYRFDFLKSEEWACIRAEVLAREGAKCFICDHEDVGNDVHHVFYRLKWKETKARDCHVLCRGCHKNVHFHMSADELKGLPAADIRKAFKVLVGVLNPKKRLKKGDFLRDAYEKLKLENAALKTENERLKMLINRHWSHWEI